MRMLALRVTGSQLHAGRALVGLSIEDVAVRARLSRRSCPTATRLRANGVRGTKRARRKCSARFSCACHSIAVLLCSARTIVQKRRRAPNSHRRLSWLGLCAPDETCPFEYKVSDWGRLQDGRLVAQDYAGPALFGPEVVEQGNRTCDGCLVKVRY
jgi:hypothetical protein